MRRASSWKLHGGKECRSSEIGSRMDLFTFSERRQRSHSEQLFGLLVETIEDYAVCTLGTTGPVESRNTCLRTDIKQARGALNARTSEPAQADDASTASLEMLHKLQPPLAVLLEAVELLRKGSLVDSQRIADMIEEQVLRAERMLEDLTDMLASNKGS